MHADLEVHERMRAPRLGDRSRQSVVTRGIGSMAALGAKALKEMKFTNVTYMQGGMRAWKEAGLSTIE